MADNDGPEIVVNGETVGRGMGGMANALVELCSPVYRCFPPQPTVCLMCGREDPKNCPFRSPAT